MLSLLLVIVLCAAFPLLEPIFEIILVLAVSFLVTHLVAIYRAVLYNDPKSFKPALRFVGGTMYIVCIHHLGQANLSPDAQMFDAIHALIGLSIVGFSIAPPIHWSEA